MGVLLGTIFVASLLGSLHCVGMCGPFALLAAADPNQRKSALIPTFAYSAGRLVTYSIVGFLFGLIGSALNQGTSFAPWQQTATYVAGGMMIAVGLIALARLWGVQIRLPRVFSPVQQFLKRGFEKARSMPPFRRAFVIGALTTLMPCGWLYTFAITAAGTGSPLWGVAVMVVFWLGTVPIMSALMLGFDRIGTSVQAVVPVMMATLVIAIGIFTIAWRAPVAIGQDTTVVTGTQQLTQQIRNVDQETLPCCSNGGEAGDR